ncbi:DUF1656 domain-containing protein [Stenotrophomonas sp. 24(2023)]|uniref:DUF1656 domain-containing protein n=1 Tax=Stenotrophomonas sp. 24(2023) TaxID=3068324 RepID=UPI0027E1AE8D|nr:DUF1656 domain-containing protein [Stenotrophomonas sp. 24(2023)]WMJ69422.1 DUF1656 domain-containing protein [Stenotrophomonas sp. 24(2023)]
MVPDLSIDGVFIPGLVNVAVIALLLALLATRGLARLGLYRVFANGPLVGLSLFVIFTALLTRFAPLLEN